jgi:hypothetical protein
LTATEQHDLEYRRGLTPAQRIALMLAILARAQAFGSLKPNLEPIRCRTLRL